MNDYSASPRLSCVMQYAFCLVMIGLSLWFLYDLYCAPVIMAEIEFDEKTTHRKITASQTWPL
jgi:hypothetical protein